MGIKVKVEIIITDMAMNLEECSMKGREDKMAIDILKGF